MSRISSTLSLGFILVLTISCQKNPFFLHVEGHSSVETALAASTAESSTAKTYAEWHAADHTPEKVFAQFLEDLIAQKTTPEEICVGLLKIPDEDLVLFENEIQKPENRVAIEPCYQELDQRMEKYWDAQHRILEMGTENNSISSIVRFAGTEVQLRDVSQGYFAVSGDLKPKQVLITFDDGPHPTNTPKILDILRKSNVRVIFFHMGQNVRANPQIVQKVAEGGHSIGSHSVTHSCLPAKNLCKNSNGGHMLSYQQGIAEIRGGHQAIYDAIGWVDPFFRFPYGEASIELKDYLRKASVGEFFWSIDSEDWKNKLAGGAPNTPSALIEHVMDQLRTRGRGIILFHDIQRRTAEALPAFLRRLYNEGYQPVVFQAKDPQARFNSKLVGPRHPID